MVEAALGRIPEVSRFARYGRVTRVVGLVIEARGLDVALGELCRIRSAVGTRVTAEVVGFHDRGILLMALGDLDGVHPGASVQPLGRSMGVKVGPGVLGRVLDGTGKPIDDRGSLSGPTVEVPLLADPPSPLDRRAIREPLVTGVRALDGFLTVGKGQRIGIFSGSGVGKSTLLGMIARHARADVNVIALLGERGREVREFVEHSLGEEGLARSTLVVATGDQSALVRSRGALVATAIAEYFRDQGKQVLLMVDSVTRVAMAWREIGLAVGEPPTTRGYPPSVFAALPRLLERAGNGSLGGITGIYTVLVEGDDFNEPVADHVRAILDGHVVLTRRLASAEHFPAIDVLRSTSRVRDQVVDEGQLHAANRVRNLMAAYAEKEDLIAVGAYERGTNPEVDASIELRPELNRYLRQPPDVRASWEESRGGLLRLGRTEHGSARSAS